MEGKPPFCFVELFSFSLIRMHKGILSELRLKVYGSLARLEQNQEGFDTPFLSHTTKLPQGSRGQTDLLQRHLALSHSVSSWRLKHWLEISDMTSDLQEGKHIMQTKIKQSSQT